MDEEELKRELEKLEQEIDLNPQNYVAYCNRGDVLDDLGRRDEALANYDKALEINPNNGAIYYNRGLLLYKLGRKKEALDSYDKALEIDPNNDMAYYNKGGILSDLGKKDEALASYDKALEINSNNDMAYCNRGVILNDLGRKNEALADYDRALEINPNNDIVYYNQGGCLNSLGQIEKALFSYNKALEISPNSYIVYYTKGNILNNLGRKEEALVNYNKALEINPDFDFAYCNRGNVLSDLGKKEEALVSYNKALEINPDFCDVYCNRAVVLAHLGRKEEALSDCDRALKNNLNTDSVYCNRGNILKCLGRKNEALDSYDKALKINPNNASVLNNKGTLLYDLEKKEEALICYIQAIQINPNNEVPKRNRRSLLGNKKFWNNFPNNSQVDLWSGDEDFNTLASREKLEGCSSKDLFRIHCLWVEQYRLLYLLSANLENVGHYTSSTVFEILLQENEEPKGKAAPLRLCSVAAANDPTEGTVFLSLLHQDCIPSPRIQSDLAVLQTSFSSAIDSLNQFRLYGKKDGEEGTGLCLVFNRDFFAAPGEASMIALKKDEEQSPIEETETGHKLPLYWVLYYDCESGHVYYTPACTEHSLNRELEMTEDSLQEDVQKRVKDIGESLKRIRTHFQAVSKEYQQTALEMLIYLRHLVKDAAFKDEKELRILSLHPYNDPSLKVLPGKDCLSVDYLPVIHDGEEYLNQVIAGPKLRDFTNLVDVARFRLHHLGGKKEVEFRQSRAPLS